MKYYLKVLTLAIVFSFGWGLWWGFYNLEKKNPKYKKGPEIRVLSMKGFFTQDFLKEIETKYKINFVLTEKDSDADLLREALSENKNYDLIQIRSFITKSFLLDSVFKPLDADRIEGQSISIDFKNMGFDPSDKYFVPITWATGVDMKTGRPIENPAARKPFTATPAASSRICRVFRTSARNSPGAWSKTFL